MKETATLTVREALCIEYVVAPSVLRAAATFETLLPLSTVLLLVVVVEKIRRWSVAVVHLVTTSKRVPVRRPFDSRPMPSWRIVPIYSRNVDSDHLQNSSPRNEGLPKFN